MRHPISDATRTRDILVEALETTQHPYCYVERLHKKKPECSRLEVMYAHLATFRRGMKGGSKAFDTLSNIKVNNSEGYSPQFHNFSPEESRTMLIFTLIVKTMKNPGLIDKRGTQRYQRASGTPQGFQ
jgi:hypothetical protein